MSMRLTMPFLIVPVAVWAMQLPPDMEADRYLLQAESAIEEQDFERAKVTMDRILELQAEHDLELPDQFSFRYAQVLERLGLYDDAMETATRYLTLVGRDGEFYREALQLLNAAEAAKATAEAEAVAAAEAARRLAGEPRAFDGMEFVWVPAGEFRMGSVDGDSDEQPVTQVRISLGFWLAKYEVTQAEWQQVMETNPSANFGCGQCPVEMVSWNEVQDFIRRLNERTRGSAYRLPTEAEWEYAARAGTRGERYGELSEIAWCGNNSGVFPHPVGQKQPNAWGLHDMLGNVYEWIHDWYGDYPGGTVVDPQGPESGSDRGDRGGSWNSTAAFCRASDRNWAESDFRVDFLGFRLARTN